MKKIHLILIIVFFNTMNTYANNSESDTNFFENTSTSNTNPGGFDNGDDPASAASIDSFLPLLVISSYLVAYRFRKVLLKKI